MFDLSLFKSETCPVWSPTFTILLRILISLKHFNNMVINIATTNKLSFFVYKVRNFSFSTLKKTYTFIFYPVQ